MRTTLRSAIAFVLSLAVLGIAIVSTAGADPQPSPSPVVTGPREHSGDITAMCAQGVPDCNDTNLGDPGQSEPGWDGVGVPPSTGSGGGGTADPGVAVPCGVEVVTGTGPDGTVSITPCPGEEPPTDLPPSAIEPQPGMADTYARPFDTASVSTDGRTVTIDFAIGVAPCYVLDHVDVAYSADAVTITLYEGHDPAAGDQIACIEIAMLARTVVTLDQPLGDRIIKDGAA